MDNEPREEPILGDPKPRGPSKGVLFLIALLCAGAVAAWLLWFSPGARVRQVVREMARTTEARDADGLLALFSKNYSDPADNNYDQMAFLIRDVAFPLIEEIQIDVEHTLVKASRGEASASVRGRITYKIKGVPKRDKYSEDSPLVIRLKKEQDGWRVISIENLDMNIAENMDDIQDVLKMF